MATYSKVILSGQPYSYPTLVTTPTLSTTAGLLANVQAPVGTAITATITNATTTGSLITYTATNTFVAGQIVTITSIVGFTNANLTNAIIASATGSSFTVNSAVATQTYTSGGTATVAVSNTTASITAASLPTLSNIVTYTATNTFTAGQIVTITGLTGTGNGFVNLANVMITTASSSAFTVETAYNSGAAVSLTAQTGTATSYNAVYSYTATVNAQVFAATQLVSTSGLTTTGYNVGSTPILSVSTLAAPTSTTYAFAFTVSVPSTLTTTLSAQTGTATALPLTGTLIHNNVNATSTALDEVWLYATNLTSSAVVLSLVVGASQLGTLPLTSAVTNITIPPNSGLTLITPGLILSANSAGSTLYSAIYAYASQANAIAISGYVNRIV